MSNLTAPTASANLLRAAAAAVSAYDKARAATQAARDLARETSAAARAFSRRSKAQAAAAALAETAAAALSQAEQSVNLRDLEDAAEVALVSATRDTLAARFDSLATPAARAVASVLRSGEDCAEVAPGVRLSLNLCGAGFRCIYSAQVNGLFSVYAAARTEERLIRRQVSEIGTSGTRLEPEEVAALPAAAALAVDLAATFDTYAATFTASALEDTRAAAAALTA